MTDQTVIETRMRELETQVKELGAALPKLIRDEIDRLRSDVAKQSDQMRIEGDVKALAQSAASVKTLIEGISSRPSAAKDLEISMRTLESVFERRLDNLSTSVTRLDKKKTPLATLLGGVALVVTVLGFSWNDLSGVLRGMSDQADETARALNSQVAIVKQHGDALKRTIDEIGPALRDFGTVTHQFETQVRNMKSYETTMAKLYTKVALLADRASKLPEEFLSLAPSQGGPEESLLRDLAAKSGGLPNYMRLLLQSQFALADGSWARARSLAVEAKKFDPDKEDGHYDFLIGQAFYQEGMYTEAIGSFEDSIALEPDEAATLNNLGSCYAALAANEDNPKEKERLVRESAKYTRMSIEVDAGNDTAVSNLSVAYNELGEYKKSLEALDACEGESAGVSYQFACTHALMGNKELAVLAFKNAILLDRTLALQAMADDDLKTLRGDEEFLATIEGVAGTGMLDAAKKAWAEEE